jgi:hypothetical protein
MKRIGCSPDFDSAILRKCPILQRVHGNSPGEQSGFTPISGQSIYHRKSGGQEVLVRIGNVITKLTLASTMCVSIWAQAAPAGQAAGAPAAPAATSGPQWKDRAEYDLFESIRTDQNGQTKLEKLNTWKEKYPDSQFKQQRLLLYLTTYQQLNQAPKMIETAKQILAADPNDFTALYWITFLTPTQIDQSAAALDAGEKAANGMLANLDATFSAAKKPAGTADDAWKKARNDMEAIAHKTLGWVAMTRKNTMSPNRNFRRASR